MLAAAPYSLFVFNGANDTDRCFAPTAGCRRVSPADWSLCLLSVCLPLAARRLLLQSVCRRSHLHRPCSRVANVVVVVVRRSRKTSLAARAPLSLSVSVSVSVLGATVSSAPLSCCVARRRAVRSEAAPPSRISSFGSHYYSLAPSPDNTFGALAGSDSHCSVAQSVSKRTSARRARHNRLLNARATLML